jgi:hypothetical protein
VVEPIKRQAGQRYRAGLAELDRDRPSWTELDRAYVVLSVAYRG